MTPWYLFVLSLLLAPIAAAENPVAHMHTNKGVIVLELDRERAPISVQNFLDYVELDGYRGSIFHRVIPGFMIQTGGYFENLTDMDEGDYIRNEAENGLKNIPGSIAMARSDEIDSAGRQFFINVNHNRHLDHSEDSCTREDERRRLAAAERGLYRPQSCRSYGYAVFGRVIEGMEVVRAIEQAATESLADFTDIPVEPIVVEKIVVDESVEGN